MHDPDPNSTQEVICIHCQQLYQENEIRFEIRFDMDEPLWWCKNVKCDGAGLDWDIHRTNEPFGAWHKERLVSD